jgi:hypothetical protein
MDEILNTRYGEIEIKDVRWHRGGIPLPKGTMLIDNKVVKKIAKEYGLDKHWDLVGELLDYLDIDIYSMDFSSSYTEFLYPGSPDLGYNFHARWIDSTISDSDLEDFLKYVSPAEKEFLLKKREDIERFLDSINDIYDKMLDYVDSYVQSLQEEASYSEEDEFEDSDEFEGYDEFEDEDELDEEEPDEEEPDDDTDF